MKGFSSAVLFPVRQGFGSRGFSSRRVWALSLWPADRTERLRARVSRVSRAWALRHRASGFRARKDDSHEAHLSAVGHASQAHARVSRSHENPWRPGRDPRASRQGSQASWGLRRHRRRPLCGCGRGPLLGARIRHPVRWPLPPGLTDGSPSGCCSIPDRLPAPRVSGCTAGPAWSRHLFC